MMNSFRKFPEVAGWLYTEHHDVINEWNGYWKYDRSEKDTGLNNIFNGMSLNDFHSIVYVSSGGDITRTVKGNENIEIPIYVSSMTNKNYGKELFLHYQMLHLDYVGIEKEIDKGVVKIDYSPWMNKSVSPIEIKTSKYSGLSKINFTRIGSRIKQLGPCLGMNGHFRRDLDVISRLPNLQSRNYHFI